MCPDILCRSCGGSGKELLPRVLIDVLSLWDLAGTWTASEAAAVLDSNATAINNRLEALRELGFLDRKRVGRRWSYWLVRSEVVA
ncbi:MAG TPA: hypothetical protein PLL72_21180 [Burkholderiaceae bacterium]|nr:hypothetical protein [Burkholderiaceae bacterium]